MLEKVMQRTWKKHEKVGQNRSQNPLKIHKKIDPKKGREKMCQGPEPGAGEVPGGTPIQQDR